MRFHVLRQPLFLIIDFSQKRGLSLCVFTFCDSPIHNNYRSKRMNYFLNVYFVTEERIS